MSQSLASEVNTVRIAQYCNEYPFAFNSNQKDQNIQCDIIVDDSRFLKDPYSLPLRDRLSWHLKQFADKTSSHGIPWVVEAPNGVYRTIWVFLLSFCLIMFIFQANSVIAKYRRNEKITSIQLKFETAPFPAITLCNLNPYKDSLLKDVDAIKKILDVYHSVLEQAGKTNRARKKSRVSRPKRFLDSIMNSEVKRQKRQQNHGFEASFAKCNCDQKEDSISCQTIVKEQPNSVEDTCMCAFDRETEDAWPCYPHKYWEINSCGYCDETGHCHLEAKEGIVNMNVKCLCQKIEPFCMRYKMDQDVLKLWEFYGKLLLNPSRIDEDAIIEALGFKAYEVAIVTKARENIIFAMAELSERQREALSIQKSQLIHKCSFNGAACDIDKDFINAADPTFGNCFVFNHNRTDPKVSVRAGANYGLRVLVFVNTTEYLPTTEAVGIRLTIHDADEYPFPETAGYSAPTGYISSFGVQLARISRLPEPYGKCVPSGVDQKYIYQGYKYSLEGCYRTCFQDEAVSRCGCGDPRFPVINAKHCQVFDPVARKCLDTIAQELSVVDPEALKCVCEQPCEQPSYKVSYSCANWPSGSLNISVGKCDLPPNECNEYYAENGAMIEVFYEALNYEVLSETEAYGLVKMMADFGGQLGLCQPDILSYFTPCLAPVPIPMMYSKDKDISPLPKRTGHPYQSRQQPSHKKPRTSFTKSQVQILENRFKDQKYLASMERSILAAQLDMSDAQVKTWFQNRRTKWRRQEAEARDNEVRNVVRLVTSYRNQLVDMSQH
ncbi:unnamed protein product [Bursaphelenchus xylophilus]|uniref:(pine wood nematode) hypothetical protein n=1 Tax=Bursaphelenchus xylophilus TaxID=6326 RepID=A0A811KZ29_BURXY|nr:unnamed protein product [Bursaphelenchus xylophilus]CAG9108944.1 unnamed protein product [Bursaphelenchus xylophilus]